jgi:hypothetical protein
MTNTQIVIVVLLGAFLGISPMRTARAACDTEAMVRAEYPGADMEYLRRPGRNCWYARKKQGLKTADEEYRETSWPGREPPAVWPDLRELLGSFNERWAPVAKGSDQQ